LRIRLFAALDQLDFVRVLAYRPPTVTPTVPPGTAEETGR